MEGARTQVSPTDKELNEKYSRVLPSGPGACVGQIGKDEVPESMVEAYFGSKSSKSGWKYDSKQTPEEAATIYDLWQRVYDERLMPNREISLQFARGLILQSMNKFVNWVEFAVSREKHRIRVVAGRKAAEIQKVESVENVTAATIDSKVSILRKQRHATSLPIPIIKLSLKEELDNEIEREMVKKGFGRSGAKNKGLDLGHFSLVWALAELTDMINGIASCKKFVSQCETELQECAIEKESLEMEARRANMLLSDRLSLLEEAKEEVQRLYEEESVLESGVSEHVEKVLDRRFHERTISLSNEVVAGCRSTILNVEERLSKSSKRYNIVVGRVSSLIEMLVRLSARLQRMKGGGGNAFFPKPIFSNRESRVSTVHLLNACPLCGFWYSCYNFMSLGCGHTYHPWCLSEHSQKSRLCLVESCQEPFFIDSATTIGIRPLSTTTLTSSTHLGFSNMPLIRKKQLSFEKLSLRVQECEVSSQNECLVQPMLPLSQSSKTKVVSDKSITNPIECNIHSNCVIYKVKQASVLLKGCGHDVTYFKCVQGLRVCPLCQSEILGWEIVKPKSSISPLLNSLGGIEDRAIDPLIQKHVKTISSKSSFLAMHGHSSVPNVVAVNAEQDENQGLENAEEQMYEDDGNNSEQDNGLVHYCNNEEFNNGRTRTISIEVPNFSEGVEDTFSKAKHAQIVKTLKALDDICSVLPPVLPKTKSVPKKKPSRPLWSSKASAQFVQQMGMRSSNVASTNVPVLYGGPRLVNATKLVLVKFRGLS